MKCSEESILTSQSQEDCVVIPQRADEISSFEFLVPRLADSECVVNDALSAKRGKAAV